MPLRVVSNATCKLQVGRFSYIDAIDHYPHAIAMVQLLIDRCLHRNAQESRLPSSHGDDGTVFDNRVVGYSARMPRSRDRASLPGRRILWQ
jgi:hypothetical protein